MLAAGFNKTPYIRVAQHAREWPQSGQGRGREMRLGEVGMKRVRKTETEGEGK